jgi:hypothetical protein
MIEDQNLHYTVTDGDVLYELIFNLLDQIWTLDVMKDRIILRPPARMGPEEKDSHVISHDSVS